MKYVVWETDVGFRGTNEKNYNSYVQNARMIHNFYYVDGFMSFDDVVDYLCKYFRLTIDEIVRL